MVLGVQLETGFLLIVCLLGRFRIEPEKVQSTLSDLLACVAIEEEPTLVQG